MVDKTLISESPSAQFFRRLPFNSSFRVKAGMSRARGHLEVEEMPISLIPAASPGSWAFASSAGLMEVERMPC